jgi:peroxiredoxin Q/BCP
MVEITVGTPAPEFTLTDKDGVAHSLSATPGKYKVVYFYPKDDTPGCTIEAKEFSESMDALQAQGTAVLGVSGGTDRTKELFCKKHGITVPLVSDTDLSVCKAYGAYGPKQFMGKTFDGIIRKTFVIGPDGNIAKIFHTVKPEGHAQEVLEVVRKLEAGEPVDVEAPPAAETSVGMTAPKKAKRKAVAKKTTKAKAAAKKAPAKKAAIKKVAPKKAAAPAKKKGIAKKAAAAPKKAAKKAPKKSAKKVMVLKAKKKTAARKKK